MAPSNSELPVWRSGLYIGVFGDAFLENTDFEGGLLEPTMRSLADAVEAHAAARRRHRNNGPDMGVGAAVWPRVRGIV